MNKTCSKCQKTVYPLEELKCLDKIWHKGCFKCTECGMTLNMKTYKGFDKHPYCEAHVPKAKATTVADTPEFKRIQENTKIQSNAVYHAEFEKAKGKFTQVADDPELMRIKQNTKIISNVAYHGDLEKKALMEQKRNLSGEGDAKGKNGVPPPRSPSGYMEEISSVPTSSHPTSNVGQMSKHQPSYNPLGPTVQSNSQGYSQSNNYQYQDTSHNYSRQQQYASQNSAMQQRTDRDSYSHQSQAYPLGAPQQYIPSHVNHSGGNPSPYSSRGHTNVIYTSEGGSVNAGSPRKVGSIADYDPMNNFYGSMDHQRGVQSQGRVNSAYGSGGYQHQPQNVPMQNRNPPPPAYTSAPRYRALYDYEAQDVDELTFLEGDLIVDCTPIDEGWLTGTNNRSKQRGMLPANYVQQV